MPEVLWDPTAAQNMLDAMGRLGVQPLPAPQLDAGQLAALFESVCRDVKAGQYEQALDDAFVLVAHEPWERRYQLALAWCLQHLGRYEHAGGFYGIALLLDATDALCSFRMGECLVAMGETEHAKEAFEATIKLSALDESYAPVALEARQVLLSLDPH